jgi:hypothetical protein
MPKGNGIITFETASELQGHVQKQLSGLLAASLKRVSALATSTDDDDGALDAAAKLSEALSARGWEHAFGGRLARASLGASLAFTEIDLTVFLDPQDAGQDLLDLAAELGLEAGGVTAETVASAEQLRTRWNGRSVDFFLGVDGFRSESRERVIHEVVGGVNLPVLCLEDQLVLAAVTNNVFPELLDFASVRSHDTAYVQRWIAELKGG